MDTSSFSWMPSASSTLANDVDAMFDFILFAATAIFAIVVLAIIFFVLRYRRRGKAGLTSGKDNNLPLEIVWTGIPIILIMIVFVWSFNDYMKMAVVPHDAMEIKVTAQRWFWTFDHPEGANAVNVLIVPVHKPIKLLMSSTDVIHSFYVPDFRMKMDVLPNRYTVTWFEATHEGVFPVFCAEYCGKGHSEMLGSVSVVSDSAYKAWIGANSALGEGLTMEQYGEQLYKTKACFTCHSTDGSIIQGPSFKGSFGSKVLLASGDNVVFDENYVRESLLNPKAKVVNGFQPIMPTFQGVLKDRQIDALVAYIKTLKK